MSLSALQAGAYLHHVHMESADPQRLADFYAATMEMSLAPGAEKLLVLQGPGRRLILSEGRPKRLVEAGFAVRDAESLAGLRERAREAGLSPAPTRTHFFPAEAFRTVDPDGNVMVFGLAAEEPPADPKILRGPIQHLTLASRNIEAIEDFYARGLGFGVSDRVVSDSGKLMTSFMRGNHEHHNLACFYQDRNGVDHHSYEAGEWDRIRDWCDHFARRGIALMWGPGRHGPGNNLFIFIVDPDENWIEVSAELEVVHDRPTKTWRHEERTLNLWGKAILRAEAPNA